MTTKSEILRKLICCAFDGAAPDDLDLSLYSCLGLYAELRLEEAAGAPVGGELPPHTHTHNAAPTAEATIEPDESPPAAAAPKSPASAAAAFKRQTHDRLRAYRAAHGLGCFVELAAECGNGVDEVTLSRMHCGERFPIELWRSVAAALDKQENKET